ncbi:peptidoglycan-binding protein [Sagittula sp. NFXS13]|uniref:peptidoglycan-binding domain-containing protein n=1 Tax=Sagittula sp. NFXS13 TaxID=2819095 RepID=UPI0032E042C2
MPVFAQNGTMFSREIRAEAQQALSYYGFDTGPADGVFGSQTRAAIRARQAARGTPATGEFSRAGLGNLLEQYRSDRRADASAADTLPMPVQGAIAEMAQMCGTTTAALAARQGLLQSGEMNNDGILDYVIDGSAARCSMICGAANCSVTTVVSNANGYRNSDFLGYGVSPDSFNCLSNGICEFAR